MNAPKPPCFADLSEADKAAHRQHESMYGRPGLYRGQLAHVCPTHMNLKRAAVLYLRDGLPWLELIDIDQFQVQAGPAIHFHQFRELMSEGYNNSHPL